MVTPEEFRDLCEKFNQLRVIFDEIDRFRSMQELPGGFIGAERIPLREPAEIKESIENLQNRAYNMIMIGDRICYECPVLMATCIYVVERYLKSDQIEELKKKELNKFI